MERYDFCVHRGATFVKSLLIKKDGAPLDLSGWSAKSQVRPEPDSPDLICEMEITIVPEEGRIRLRIGQDVTARIPAGTYAWDIRVTDDEDAARYYLGGAFLVLPSVTQ